MSYVDAAPSNLSKRQVHSIAEEFANKFAYAPGDDIHDLVTRLGGRVSVEDTLLSDPDRAGSLYVDAPNDFRIVLPAHTGAARDRFTLAHELGHYVLHYLWNKETIGQPLMALRRGSDRIEWEANWFAAALLMPEASFRATFADCDGDLVRIARTYDVSPAAAEVRAKGLGLL